MYKELSEERKKRLEEQRGPNEVVIPRDQWKRVFDEVAARQNEIAQAPPAQNNQETEKVPAGGCLPRPCSALDEELWDKIASNNSRNLEELLSTSK